MRILVIEDHTDIAENIGDYLEPKGHVLDFATDGITGLHLALTQNYDVIVLDLMLPAMDGITVCRKLRTEGKKDTPLIMLTARDRVDERVLGLQAGADDYLVKPFALPELEARLQALQRRGSGHSTKSILQVADLQFDPETLTTTRGGQTLNLNPTMRSLLQVLMENTHRVVSREQLEHTLWGDDPPDKDVLRAHIYTLRNIIDKPFPQKLLQTVHGAGYRLAPPEQH